MDFARARHEADIVALWRVGEFPGKVPLEVCSFSSREVIPATDDIAPVGVRVRVEVVKEGDHLCGVATAAKDD